MTFVPGVKEGNVPTARVGPVIAQLIAERWPESRRGPEEAGGKEILAEKVGCAEDTIDAIVRQTHDGVSFDLADKLLCALGRWDMWHGVLADIYPTKFMETCALPGCGKRFPEGGRGRPKRYCCKQHTKLAYDIRTGNATGMLMRKRGYCLRGHKMTPENSKRVSGGKFQCRQCDNERRRLRRKNDPAAAERAREYDRSYRRRKAARAA